MISSNPVFAPLFNDDEVAAIFSDTQLIAHFIEFDAVLCLAAGDAGLIDAGFARKAAEKVRQFKISGDELGQGSFKDGVPIPLFVQALKQYVGQEFAPAIHLGATSQDVLDTALVLNLRALSGLVEQRLTNVTDALAQLKQRFGDKQIMGRTRMQAALPISIADRVYAWHNPLNTYFSDLSEVKKNCEKLQFGGAVGTRDKLGAKGADVAQYMAAHFQLQNPPKAWHTERGSIVDYGHFLTKISGTLGKMGLDICLMAQQGVDEIKILGGGKSSAMPHKQNPVLAELLVSLARYNAGHISTLHHAMLHEQERSGMAWAVEWMVLPQMACATGKALDVAHQLLQQIEFCPD